MFSRLGIYHHQPVHHLLSPIAGEADRSCVEPQSVAYPDLGVFLRLGVVVAGGIGLTALIAWIAG